MPEESNAALNGARQALQRLADELNRNPANIDAWLTAASVLTQFGEFSQAETAYRRVLAIEPRHGAARFGLAQMLLEQGELTEATPIIDALVSEQPQSADVWALLAALRQKQVRDEEAADALRRSLTFRPDAARHSNLLQILQCADNVAQDVLLAAHQQWNVLYATPIRHVGPIRHRDRNKPLRLGFLSADFGRHPLGFMTLRPLELLDKSHCSIVCYYDRTPEDDYTARFRAAADQWRVTDGWSDEQLAQQIQSDGIDILFDLMGHTGHRLLVFARKPAPVQITWFGYVGTTGLAAMDFLLADRFHVREGEERHFCEKILRMPHGYAVYEPPADAPEVAPLPALSSGCVTFGCFNNAAKFSRLILDAWAQVLLRAPQARLLLKNRSFSQAEYRDRLHAHFATSGIPPQRIILEGAVPHHELLAAYNRVDLALDTQPYSGGLTTCEALWMGVPVVTFPGATFAGRHSVSHLSNAGLLQFSADDLDGYLDLAAEWAERLDELASLRQSLRDRLGGSPLCDAPRFASDFLELLEHTVNR